MHYFVLQIQFSMITAYFLQKHKNAAYKVHSIKLNKKIWLFSTICSSLQLCYSFNTLLLLSRLGKNLLPIAFAAKNDVPVKKEMLSPVKTCSFDEQIKG